MPRRQVDDAPGTRLPPFGPNRHIRPCVDGSPLARVFLNASAMLVGAAMCPASHEGVPVKLFLHRRLLRFRAPWRIQFLSKAELSSQQGTSPATSHPAGRCPNHGPTFGTGELQEGGTTLLERRFRARPDNGDAPLDPYTRAARRPWLNQRC